MEELKYTIKDFKSENEVRWCPGCGDFAIMNAVQRVMADQGIPHEKYAIISGIGCSSRFPYYMSTFGFHTIHGRAMAVASGVKCANPDLSVWVITGDGDAMAIGGNHFIHLIRRNIDLNVIIFNNKIYGLTKGQYSPTTDRGFKTKTSPFGTIEDPFVPGQLVIGARGTFYARSIDGNLKLSQEVFAEAAKHQGTSIVEVLQNCMIYNNGVHDHITNPEFRAERQLILKQGEPMLFGPENNIGLTFSKGKLKVVTPGKDGITLDDILVHDATEPDPSLHLALVNMQLPDFPVAFGVIRNVPSLVYDQEMSAQIKEIQKTRKITCMDDLLLSGNTWEIKNNGYVPDDECCPCKSQSFE
jgi:2-oxoglutarate/2-oxoacid ferredoxin oxidoreductase subunit beta